MNTMNPVMIGSDGTPIQYTTQIPDAPQINRITDLIQQLKTRNNKARRE